MFPLYLSEGLSSEEANSFLIAFLTAFTEMEKLHVADPHCPFSRLRQRNNTGNGCGKRISCHNSELVLQFTHPILTGSRVWGRIVSPFCTSNSYKGEGKQIKTSVLSPELQIGESLLTLQLWQKLHCSSLTIIFTKVPEQVED